MRFDSFYGNNDVKEHLALAYDSNCIPHAIILEGPQGCGKRTLAHLLAKAAVCIDVADRPCGICSGCTKATAGSHPDIHVASGGTAARSFHVESIRFIRSDAYIRPNEAACKVYLLFQAETMSEQAQNALLKILEEPPAQVLFILTCVSAASLLPTVRSRSQIFTLAPVTAGQAVTAATQLCPEATTEQLQNAAKEWGGNIGLMAEALQSGKTNEAIVLAQKVTSAITEPDDLLLLQAAAPFLKNKDLFRTALDRLALIFRDAIVLRVGGGSISGEECARELSVSLTKERLIQLGEVVVDFQKKLNQNANTTLTVTAFCSALRTAAGR